MFRLLYIAALFALLPQPVWAADNPSFLNEIIPLLTKQGCNQGACHGKGAGQNGFRLSLRGYAPELDHRWLTREFDGRRLDPADPAASLLLRKPTAEAPHEGGKLFAVGSREYRLLLDWLTAGAPGPDTNDPTLTKLELTPTDHTLKPGDTVQLTAWATFSDGTRKDVTWLTTFDTNDPAIITVTPHGQATAQYTGTTAVRAMFQAEVAVATFAVPADQPIDPRRYEATNNFIDKHVLAKLNALRIEPSDLCSDEEFVRRVYLDACGCLPRPDDVTRFLADPDPHKRAKLIDHILQQPEFTEYWTLILADLLQNRKERDHDVRGIKGVRQFHAWLRDQVAANRPWNELARDVLTATGSTIDNPAVGYYIVTVGEHHEPERSEAAESVAQAFLGVRIGCARCHNHPLERYTQDDFYHFAAFFSRVHLKRQESKKGPTELHVSHRDAKRNAEPVGVIQPRTGAFLKPQPLDRSPVHVQPGDDPRQTLAKWITSPDNEYFAGAMVNRVWRHYLGVGLVEPVDDLRATNPPSIPALWDALRREFVEHRFDLRHLMRVILNSRTYQLSSATRPGNATDDRLYSHYYARRLPAEVLYDAVCDVTDLRDSVYGYPAGTRAVQLPDPAVGPRFLQLFGRSERVSPCACERSGDVTMPQLLHLQNAESLLNKIAYGWLGRRLNEVQDDDKLIDELFLRTLCRLGQPQERATVKALLAAGDPRPEVYRDLFWAVLNSKEFVFNH
jgi:hypothetical protein